MMVEGGKRSGKGSGREGGGRKCDGGVGAGDEW